MDEKIDKVLGFFKAAFVADSAEIVPPSKAAKMQVKGAVRLTSSERGTFYVALVEPANPDD